MKKHGIFRWSRIPYYMCGKFRDWDSGYEYFDHTKFAGPYEGYCWAIGSIFETWIDRATGERARKCVQVNA